MKQKMFCRKLYLAERKKFYTKININELMDNWTFWKTMTPFLSSKAPRLTRSTMIGKKA